MKLLNNIFNEDCFQTIDRIKERGGKVDVILTSPPYNTARNRTSEKQRENYDARYDVHMDNKTNDEYAQWTIDLFNEFDQVLKENGVVLYNISYSTDTQTMNSEYRPNELLWCVINDIIVNTPFTVGDCITWKKGVALPSNTSSNKLTRICEFVFVLVRKSEFKTYTSNKQVKSVSRTGQKFYENYYNFIEAKNNDGANKLNKATYSTELCEKLLSLYAQPKSVVYDPFMGTGTTAVACQRLGHYYLGSEILEAQVEFALNRLKEDKEG